MKVTVYDKVPATAEITVEQTEAYLRRMGWVESTGISGPFWRLRDEANWMGVEIGSEVYLGDGSHLGLAIQRIAGREGCPPSEVLADIAKEPT